MKKLTDYVKEKNIDLKDKLRVKKLAKEAFDRFLDEFDVSKYKNDLDKQTTNFAEIYKFAHDISEDGYINDIYGNDKINEDKKIEPIYNVVERLKQRYHLFDYQFMAYAPNHVTVVSVKKIPNYLKTTNSILLNNTLENVATIKKEFEDSGYYCTSERAYKPYDYVILIFDPYKQEDIGEQIRSSFTQLYHFTPLKNHESIMKNGFVPMNEGRMYTYFNNRIYLCTTDPKSKSFTQMLSNVSKSRKHLDESFDGKFMLYTVDVDKIPNNINFYYDAHGQDCVYVTEHLPFDIVINYKEIK